MFRTSRDLKDLPLFPCPMVSGSPDPWFIVSEFPEQAKIIRSAREINNYKTEWAIEKVKSTDNNSLNNVSLTTSEKSFKSAIEKAIKNHIQQCIKDTPNELKHTPMSSTLIMDSTTNYAQSLIDNLNLEKTEL